MRTCRNLMSALRGLVLVVTLKVFEIVTSISVLLRILMRLVRASSIMLVALVAIAAHVVHLTGLLGESWLSILNVGAHAINLLTLLRALVHHHRSRATSRTRVTVGSWDRLGGHSSGMHELRRSAWVHLHLCT